MTKRQGKDNFCNKLYIDELYFSLAVYFAVRSYRSEIKAPAGFGALDGESVHCRSFIHIAYSDALDPLSCQGKEI